MKNIRRFAGTISVAVCIAAWLGRAGAFGQSAEDGFECNADGPVHAIAVQADGKIIVGGAFTNVGGMVRSNIARLHVDGRVDTSFNPGMEPTFIGAIHLIVQPDGKILVGGNFRALGGQAVTNLGRLNVDGSVDASFHAPGGLNVNALALQADGKILAGGKLALAGRQGLVRLNADGSLDDLSVFGNNSVVDSLAVQPDGKILVGGSFTLMAGQTRLNLGRLLPDGTLDSVFNPGANGKVQSLAVQPDGRILVGGMFTTLGGQPRAKIGRLYANGTLDSAFTAGVGGTDSIFSPQVRNLIVQPDGKILVGGIFINVSGQSHTNIARLNVDGSVDDAFAPLACGKHSSTSPTVYSLAVQSDGKILVGGDFPSLNGVARTNLGRIYANGLLDASFQSNADYLVTALAVQPDGRILVGGFFRSLAGQPRQSIGRLWPDGNLDAGFHPIVTGYVYSVIVQMDGRIVLGGEITSVNGQVRSNIARVHADGSLDAGFNPGANGRVLSLAVQADGKLLVAGAFNRLGGQARSGLGRFNVDGSLDSDFHPVLPSGVAPYGIQTMAVQADGKILVGPAFGDGGDLSPTNLARVHPDGQMDHEFNPDIRGLINCLAVDRDGRILVGGYFRISGDMVGTKLARLQTDGTVDGSFDPSTNAGGLFTFTEPESIALSMDGNITVGASMLQPAPAARAGLAFLYRLRSDGALDNTFDGGANGLVHGVAVQADGRILAGGEFSMLGGAPRSVLGRLTSGGAALQTLTLSDNGGLAIWTRNGSAPEVGPVTFETSTDGTNYNLVGPAIRVGNSWQQRLARTPGFTGTLYVRARGRTVGGYSNGSSGLIESVAQFWRLPPPFLSSVQVLGGGAFQFSFANTNAACFTVWASTNVTLPRSNWTALGSPVPVGNDLYQFTDPGATNHARRFYQLRWP